MGPLRFGAIVLAYNQEQYISYSLPALAPHVEHVAVMCTDRPWSAYNTRAREMFRVADGTRDIVVALARRYANVSIIDGEWDREEDMRNDGLTALRRSGVDVCLSVDPDEFYPEGGLDRLKAKISRRNTPGVRYYVPYVGCFKRFDRMIEDCYPEESGAVRPFARGAAAVHLDADTRFYYARHTTGPSVNLPPTFFFWHLGYVLSDERMWEKVNSWAHVSEVLPRWFNDKWLRWTPETCDLFYRDPAWRWKRTVPLDPLILPEILHTHPYFPKHGTLRTAIDGRPDGASRISDMRGDRLKA